MLCTTAGSTALPIMFLMLVVTLLSCYGVSNGFVHDNRTNEMIAGTATASSTTSNSTTVPPSKASIPQIPIIDSQDWECGLTTTEDTVQLLKHHTSNKTIFLYLKLSFLHNDSYLTPIDFSDNIRSLLTDSDDVVDPRTWIWAREGKGTNLLTCSFDFKILSLTTLSLGVGTMKPVDIILPSNDTTCFWNATDTKKLNILAKSIAQLIASTVPGANGTAEPAGDTVFKVCLERVDPNPNAIYKLLQDAHILRQLSTTYDCWTIVKGSRDVGHIIYRDKITSAWLDALYVAGVIVALFFPLYLVSIFTWKHPPIDINGKQWISLNTSPLPVGFKYSIYLWQPNQRAGIVKTSRALVTIMFLFSLQYIPVLCSLLQDPERFWAHKKALDRTGLLRTSKDYMYVLSDIVFCLIPSIIFALLYNSGYDRGLFKRMIRNSVSIGTRPFSTKGQICSDDGQDSDIHVLHKNLKRNFFAILDSKAWTSAICSRWVFFNVPCLILSALPLSYCGLLIGKTAIWCLTNDLLGAFISSIVFITFYFFTIKIITVFIYIAQICMYTYTGFVTNADDVGLIFILVLLDLFFILTALSILYDKYYELFIQSVKLAEEIMNSKERLTQGSLPPKENQGSVELTQDIPEVGKEYKRVIDVTQNCSIVEYTNKQVPMIEIDLFKKLIEQYMPYRKTICKAMFRQILPVIIVSICGYQVVNDIVINKSFYSMFNFLMSVALSGAIPAISDIMGRSRSEVICSLESRKRDIRQFILTYDEEKQRQVITDSVEVASSQDDDEIEQDQEGQAKYV